MATQSSVLSDSATPWVLDIAKGLGIFRASFFTHSCAVGAVYYNVHQGLLRVPLKEPTISVPGLPLLEPQGLPSFMYDPGSYPSLNLVVSRFFQNSLALIGFSSTHSMGWKKRCTQLDENAMADQDNRTNLPSMYLDNTEACVKWVESGDIGTLVGPKLPL